MTENRAGINKTILKNNLKEGRNRTNGHLKTDYRLGRNFYKGIIGDNINVMLAAAAYNFKRMMNKRKSSFWLQFKLLLKSLINRCPALKNIPLKYKWAF